MSVLQSNPNSFIESNIIDVFIQKNMTVNYDPSQNQYHIFNRNDDQYYDIYIKVYETNADLQITRHIVRHDDSVVSHNVRYVNTSIRDLPNHLLII